MTIVLFKFFLTQTVKTAQFCSSVRIGTKCSKMPAKKKNDAKVRSLSSLVQFLYVNHKLHHHMVTRSSNVWHERMCRWLQEKPRLKLELTRHHSFTRFKPRTHGLCENFVNYKCNRCNGVIMGYLPIMDMLTLRMSWSRMHQRFTRFKFRRRFKVRSVLVNKVGMANDLVPIVMGYVG